MRDADVAEIQDAAFDGLWLRFGGNPKTEEEPPVSPEPEYAVWITQALRAGFRLGARAGKGRKLRPGESARLESRHAAQLARAAKQALRRKSPIVSADGRGDLV